MTLGGHPWLKQPVTQQRALIIPGGYRCGTTSLFAYLADHPEINPAIIKEPAFFYSRRFRHNPAENRAYPPGDEAWAYRSLFRRRPDAPVWLEGSAMYLHDRGCAARIRAGLPEARIVILLREPIARLVSWYKFLLLQGMLPASGGGFESWVREQIADATPLDERPLPRQAIAQGHYAASVAEYLQCFGRERVELVWFDDLKRDPRAVLRRVCALVGIRPDFYDDYTFPVQNEARKLRYPRAFAAYQRAHRRFFRLFGFAPRLQHELRVQLFGRLEPWALQYLTTAADPLEVHEPLAATLREYYRADLEPLRALVGTPAPWEARRG